MTMAEAATEPSAVGSDHRKQRKRKRLSQVVDKLSLYNNNNNNHSHSHSHCGSEEDTAEPAEEDDEEVFSDAPSPHLSFSPLRLGGAPDTPPSQPPASGAVAPRCSCAHCFNFSFEQYLHTKYLPDIFRRRSHSDSDLPLWLDGAERGAVSYIFYAI